MFDTYVTIVGNVLTAPEWRRTTQTNTLVANFKVASTARRLDRENNRWVDGNSLRVRVNCWRKLAEGVASSIMLGDPVVVVGRLYTRDWVDGEGNNRIQYEMEAVAVGHDLARGRSRFMRNRPTLATSEVEQGDAERRVHGEATTDVSPDEVPPTGNELFDADDDPTFAEPSRPSPVEGAPPLAANGRPAVTLAIDVLAAAARTTAEPADTRGDAADTRAVHTRAGGTVGGVVEEDVVEESVGGYADPSAADDPATDPAGEQFDSPGEEPAEESDAAESPQRPSPSPNTSTSRGRRAPRRTPVPV
ncbi:single-stranded DNA-binding protein [Solwaraspora sp. WMMD406]|uniref:single-stranded DNA-binding protein n=1 Tax=Solwaraspora sp. WMMD406 TaxID=3016095 RepID=UPI002417F125|nr:single-stranded DNA-binding protein [Solwaraspora sp. WMMD406]MDG4764353.1 single-stranded DNA-binding protein [Solwaraspora sp. WMMD406]